MDFSSQEGNSLRGRSFETRILREGSGFIFRFFILAAVIFVAAGCTTVRTTSPARSAQEMLVISTAADRAAAALAVQVPANLTAYIDPSGFSAQDQAYGMAAIKDALLRRGVRLVEDRAQANAIVLPRAGTLSTDERQSLLGIPSLPLPVAVMSGAYIPPLSLYQESEVKGIAKFAATVYEPRTGKLIVSTDPAYGFSSADDGVVLFFITWRRNDTGLDAAQNPPQVAASGK